MSHFARIDGLSAFTLTTEISSGTEIETVTLSGFRATVQEVIVAGQDFINTGYVGDPSTWIQCSYNHNVRNMFPGPGYIYESIRDIFYPVQPFPSWVLVKVSKKALDKENNIITVKSPFIWQPPIPYPETKGVNYKWNEAQQNWEIL